MLLSSKPPIHGELSLFIIIPVHNRRTTTLSCLEHLATQSVFDTFQIVVINDGCTDGTEAAIKAKYPQIRVISSNGNLWWTGAIELGMRHAYDAGAEYILWLNDDALPAEGTLDKLISFCRAHPHTLAASQCYFDGAFTYGGQTRQRFCQIPTYAAPDQIVSCDALDGNLVCLPRSVVDDIGYPLGKLIPHYGGDNLYTWSAKQAGYALCLLGNAVSSCPRDHPQISWTLDPDPIWKHWRAAASPKTSYYLPGYWHFCIRYWGIWGVAVFMRPYLRLVLFTVLRLALPRKWLHFLKERFGNTSLT